MVTIIDHVNYGNRLQNYAMQRIITGLGFDCTTIVNQPGTEAERAARRRSPARALLVRARRAGVRLFGGPAEAQEKKADPLRLERKQSGLAFTRAHIRETDFTLYRDTPAGHVDAKYDYFVAGSDQVWNPEFRRLSEVDFLTFAAQPKRIAFSASMGVADLPAEVRDFYRERLSAFAHISVREQAAADVIRALTGREVAVTIDPTLLLDAAAWAALARRHPSQPSGEYLLTYFLGPQPEPCQRLVERCAARHGLAVVHLNDRESRAFYAAAPDEFLALIRDARLHLTDSFHGVIFSVIFGRPFGAFDRAYRQGNLASRLDTLLATLRLEHRKLGDAGDAEIDRLLEPDYGHVAPIVAARAADARAYLAAALGLPARPAGAYSASAAGTAVF